MKEIIRAYISRKEQTLFDLARAEYYSVLRKYRIFEQENWIDIFEDIDITEHDEKSLCIAEQLRKEIFAAVLLTFDVDVLEVFEFDEMIRICLSIVERYSE